MALQIHMVNYGELNPKTTNLNTAEYAAKVAAGLRRIADGLVDEETVFLRAADFPRGEEDNTWVHFSLVTEPAVTVTEINLKAAPIPPRAQFNVHFYMKAVVNETEFAGGLTEQLGGTIDG